EPQQLALVADRRLYQARAIRRNEPTRPVVIPPTPVAARWPARPMLARVLRGAVLAVPVVVALVVALAVSSALPRATTWLQATVAADVLVLAAALSAHDVRTRGHSERVRAYSELIAEQLGMSLDERDRLRWASLLHDIGKVSVQPSILNKRGPLDEKEIATIH